MNLNISYNYKITDIGEPEWYQNVYKEIWLDHEYSRYGVEVEEDDIVVDCGANVGFFTLYALDVKRAKHVYSIECEPKNIDCLNVNLKDKKATILPGWAGFEEENYNVGRILREYNLSHIDFMKIDIECGEYPFILNTPNEYLRKINKLVIELHNIFNYQDKIYQIFEKFTKNGFDLNFEQVHKNTNLALLYVKKR